MGDLSLSERMMTTVGRKREQWETEVSREEFDLTTFSPSYKRSRAGDSPSPQSHLGVDPKSPRWIPLSKLPNQVKRRKIKVLKYYVELTDLEWMSIDQPHFNALRFVQQMGTAMFAYPAAVETRWMHMLLTLHFSNMAIQEIKVNMPELTIPDRWIEAVRMAALWHDAGHACFSHLADYHLFSNFPDIPAYMKDHETRGTALFAWVVRHYKLSIDDEQVRLIQHLITGEHLEGYPRWLFMIVNNAKSSLDVDKMAYLHSNAIASHGQMRDLQIEHILSLARVMDDEICYPRKLHRLILDIFHHRKLAFAELYRHPINVKTEALIICVFRHMAKAFEWHKLLQNPEADGHKWRLVLTDAAVYSLPGLVNNPAVFERFSTMQQEELTKAYALFVRLERREWFATIEELSLVPAEVAEVTESLETQIDQQEQQQFTFEYTVGYSNNKNKNPIDDISMFTTTPNGYRIESLRTVLEQEQGGCNLGYEKHRIVLLDEDHTSK